MRVNRLPGGASFRHHRWLILLLVFAFSGLAITPSFALAQLDPTADNDNDGVSNGQDPDDDNDGIPDNLDPFPLDSTRPGTPSTIGKTGPDDDFDGDGLLNQSDPDDDNDGVPDADDSDPFDPDRAATPPTIGKTDPGGDFDGDGVLNQVDPDDDNDGVSDGDDPAPFDSQLPGRDSVPAFVDSDRDGIADSHDPDDDNDGITDENDPAPFDPAIPGRNATGNVLIDDNDGDGIPNSHDPDDDNDGVEDRHDPAPFDPEVTEPVPDDNQDDGTSNSNRVGGRHGDSGRNSAPATTSELSDAGFPTISTLPRAGMTGITNEPAAWALPFAIAMLTLMLALCIRRTTASRLSSAGKALATPWPRMPILRTQVNRDQSEIRNG
jgi:hypothetical protein